MKISNCIATGRQNGSLEEHNADVIELNDISQLYDNMDGAGSSNVIDDQVTETHVNIGYQEELDEQKHHIVTIHPVEASCVKLKEPVIHEHNEDIEKQPIEMIEMDNNID